LNAFEFVVVVVVVFVSVAEVVVAPSPQGNTWHVLLFLLITKTIINIEADYEIIVWIEIFKFSSMLKD
jgi:hypothetical protein